MTRQRSLVTGANGQDGVYLVEKLLARGDEVHGMCHSHAGAALLAERFPSATAHVADLGDATGIRELVDATEPTRVFNLAGNTSVARSWEFPAEAADVLGVGPIRLLEASWNLSQRTGRPVRMLQASSAEIFGDATEVPQTERTPLVPVTPYGAAKMFAHEMAGVYRARGMFVSSAVLYNHESPRRPDSFVARKIAMAVARIALGRQETITLGNIDVHRDWGYAPDFVDAMIRIISQPTSDDFIVATGVSHSVREFVSEAFAVAGVTDWEDRVIIDPALYRPADPKQLVGDPTKLRSIGWEPSVSFHELVGIMIAAELEQLS
ncbi:GDP-mannose 4,6-dehydratase [Lacisediminihabitans sp. G11-30]|uniref:GDP-mannose 4,6-dehydratase n=1 Tax=Lacisediminihabitans changchengi TaxID=2787634 RepID=A0A934SGW7_9MICO|nr:GDP-mannose 4,6-dehydratase [Lacisediminihabitans changchengi]MBK4348910.1 GDP-mannose 4,6-dehydratase [Lacisediminihabitans changchengi]